RVIERPSRVRQNREIHVRVDLHRRGDRLVIESDIVEDQNDAATGRCPLPVARCPWVGVTSNGQRRTDNNERRLRNETPNEKAEEAENGNEGQQGDGAERASSWRYSESRIPASHTHIHF